MKYLAIDIGGTYTKFAIMSETGDFCNKGKIPTRKKDHADILDMLSELFMEQERLISERLAGIAISCAGFIDNEKGLIRNAGTLYCVEDLYICEELSKRCHVSVSVENDAKCAALAEVWKGALCDCDDSAVMILGTAVGGAVIRDKKIFSGKNGMVGEFSYILTNSEAPDDPNMTAAMYCGVPALIKLAADAKGLQPETVTGEMVFQWVKDKDEKATDALRSYSRRLAVQILNWQYTAGSQKVALGGGISEQPLLLKYVSEELQELPRVYPYSVPVPEVVNCRFYNDANLIGALYVLLNQKKAV